MKHMCYVAQDYHIHTRYSHDVEIGSFWDYCVIAEENDIQLGFLDHFDVQKFQRPDYLLSESRITCYLENFDEVKASYPEITIGLEINYDPGQREEFALFLNDHRKEFDRYIVAVHAVFGGSVTVRSGLEYLLRRYPFSKIEEEYFKTLRSAIRFGLFDGVAHPDVIYRYVNDLVAPKPEYDLEVLSIGKLCKTYGLMMELNIKGIYHPVGRTYPAPIIVKELSRDGVNFFVGSDSHSLMDFSRMKNKIIEMSRFLRKGENVTKEKTG